MSVRRVVRLQGRHAARQASTPKGAGELGVAVPDEEAEGSGPVAVIHEQVARLLGGPCAVRVGGHAEDVHVPGRYLHDEQHVQASEEDRVDMEEVAGEQPVRLRAQERRREVSTFRGAGLRQRARRIRRAVARLIWCPSRDRSPWTLRYPQVRFSRASRSTKPRISWLVLGRPGGFGYVHVRVISRRCQASSVPSVTNRWARSTVGPVRLGPGDLAPEHRDLLTEHHDLRVLGRLAAAEQHKPAKDPGHDQVEQTKGHKPRSCRNRLVRPNRRSQHLRRVLKRYTDLARQVADRVGQPAWIPGNPTHPEVRHVH